MPAPWQTRTDRAPPDHSSGERIEPTIVDHGVPAGASSAYEKLHGLGVDFGESAWQQPRRARVRRMLMMAGVFVVGAGVGLGAAVWIGKQAPAGKAALSTTPSATVRNVPVSPQESARPSAVRGISPSELPYDGAPPPPAEQPSAIADAPREPARKTIEAASGSSPVSAMSESRSGTGADNQSSAGPVEPAPASDVKKAAVEDAPKADKAARQGNTNMAAAAPKRKSVTRTDREIERIRRQVDEELKKKTDHGRAPGDARPVGKQGARNDDAGSRNASSGAGLSRVSATRASLARCEKSDNFIRRELCRWKVCNGSWGRNGCPSYQQQASTY